MNYEKREKVEEFQEEIESLKKRLQLYPESGESDEIESLRKLPIYQGRYSIKWIVQKANQTLILIALTDLKYPKALRNFELEDL